MGQTVGNEFKHTQQIRLPILAQHPVLMEEGSEGPGFDAGGDQVRARDLPLRPGGTAVMHLAALEQGDHFAVADDRDDEFAQAGMAPIAQRQRATPGLEKTALVAHPAQRPARGILLQPPAEGCARSADSNKTKRCPSGETSAGFTPKSRQTFLNRLLRPGMAAIWSKAFMTDEAA